MEYCHLTVLLYNIKNWGAKMYKKASSTLLRLNKNVSLRLHVMLSGKARDGITEIPDEFYSVFSNSNGDYVSYDARSFLSLEIKDDRPWNPSRSLAIHTRNIFPFMQGVNLILSHMYEKDSFFLTGDGQLAVNGERLKDYTVNFQGLGQNQFMVMQPALYYEVSEDDYYEGVLVELNNSENFFVIPLSVLEALKYTMDKFDFTLYTNSIVNMYLNTLYNPDIKKNAFEKMDNRVSVFTSSKNDEDLSIVEQKNIKGPSVNKGELTKDTLLDI